MRTGKLRIRQGGATFSFNVDLDRLPVPDRLKILIHEKFQEIKAKSAGGGYIFRGESKHYDLVSSTLYRKYLKMENKVINAVDMDIMGKAVDATDINIIQANLLKQAMEHDLNDPAKMKKRPELYKYGDSRMGSRFIRKNFEVLTEIQHWGGATNLIDFTSDYKVALFFACESNYDCDGRVILKNRKSMRNFIRIPKEPKHRVKAQKSVFILPPKGYIETEPNLVINIPKELKKTFMKLLLLHRPQVIEEKIYGDLHGFIKIEERYQQAYILFVQALDLEKKAENADDKEQKSCLFEEAIRCYEKIIEEMPSLHQAHFRCGILYDKLGELEKAITCAREATEWKPHDHGSFGLLGKCLFGRGKFKEAIKKFSVSIRLNRDYAEGYFMRGDVYLHANNDELAIQDYSKAIELEPDKYHVYVSRGIVYLKKNEPDLAISDFTKSLRLKSNSPPALIHRGYAYLQKDEFRLAIKDLTAAIEISSCEFLVFACRGYAYLKMKNYDRSTNDFHKTLELEPNYHVVHLYLGFIYAGKEKLENAVSHYSKLVDIDQDLNASNSKLFVIPNGKIRTSTKNQLVAKGRANRAVVYIRMQKWEKARADILATQKMKEKGNANWFKNIHGSIENFEKNYGVEIPQGLVKLLSP